MANRKRVQEHAGLAAELQDLLLKEYKRRFELGQITSSDIRNLQDLLVKNGWSFDPNELPEDLKQKLTEDVSYDDDPENERHLQVMP
jgi:hypothetical protein